MSEPSATPAEIIRQFLLDESLATVEDDWPVYVSFFPSIPDESICIYDTVGRQDGRLMEDGFQIEHPGIQVRVRGPIYATVYEKANSIALALDAAGGTVVELSSNQAYTLLNVSRTSPIIPLGVETEGDRRRHHITVNAVLTLQVT